MTQKKSSFQNVICNFKPKVRVDHMAGKEYQVVPMVMMVTGVHEGNSGKLLYPNEEMAKTPEVWNTKPVIVYHPAGSSACDPDILTNRQIGVVMNTKHVPGERGKWTAEAWLEPDRIKEVDERVGEAIENEQMMELSTGLFTDIEVKNGEFEGEKYEGIATNYRPDHLAVLPDLVGACSMEDGAGFLRMNEDRKRKKARKMLDNEMGHGTLRSLLSSALREKDEDAWIEEVYDSAIIYEKGGQLYKLNYTEDGGGVELIGEVEEVVKVIEYRTITGAFIGNNIKEQDMDKKKIVKELIENKSTKWTKEDQKTLMGLDNGVLEKLVPVTNQDDDSENKSDKTDESNNSFEDKTATAKTTQQADDAQATSKKPDTAEQQAANSAENKKPITVNEYIANAPTEIQDVLNNGMAMHLSEKKRLVNVITANERNRFTEEQLNGKGLDELRNLACLASNQTKQAQSVGNNYGGQADSYNDELTNNEQPLELPSTDPEK